MLPLDKSLQNRLEKSIKMDFKNLLSSFKIDLSFICYYPFESTTVWVDDKK